MSRIPDRTPKGWRYRDTLDDSDGRAPDPELVETENPVVGRLLDAKGDTLRVFRERRTVEFGYRNR